jgi:hypothetical protein
LLLVTALISIGTKSISVSAPYATRSAPLPVIIYRAVELDGKASATALPIRVLERDLDYIQSGFNALSEQDIVAALRNEAPFPEAPVLLVFNDEPKSFHAKIKPLLAQRQLPWFSMRKITTLVSEMRRAGYPITRLERAAVFSLEEQLPK